MGELETNQEVKEVETSDVTFNVDAIENFTEKNEHYQIQDQTCVVNKVFDIGASERRSLNIIPGKRISMEDIRQVPSSYSIIPMDTDLSIYTKTSEDINENGEYIIVEQESQFSNLTYFKEEVRVLQNALIDQTGRIRSYIDNQKDKTDDIGIFINILTDLADTALHSRVNKLQASVAFPIPPKERYSSSERLEEVKTTIAGIYKVKMPRYNFECEIHINPKDIKIYAEGEVAFIYFITTGETESKIRKYMNQSLVLCDLGQSTFNMSLMRNGRIQSAFSLTEKIGGDNLISLVHQILSRTRKQAISVEKAREAVMTGYITMGSKREAVGNEVTQAKIEMVEVLFNKVKEFLRTAMLNGSDVYAYMFLGRGMLPTGKFIDPEVGPEADYSPPISELLYQKLKEISPDSQAIVLKNLGLANLLGCASQVIRS